MTRDELNAHLTMREGTRNGTIARAEKENHAGESGRTLIDVQPVAVAFFKAAHEQPCSCRYCEVA